MTVQFDCTELNIFLIKRTVGRNALALNLPFNGCNILTEHILSNVLLVEPSK